MPKDRGGRANRVVRLLVSDMADQHLVEVHRPARFDDRPPDLSLLERVLYGLRQI